MNKNLLTIIIFSLFTNFMVGCADFDAVPTTESWIVEEDLNFTERRAFVIDGTFDFDDDTLIEFSTQMLSGSNHYSVNIWINNVRSVEVVMFAAVGYSYDDIYGGTQISAHERVAIAELSTQLEIYFEENRNISAWSIQNALLRGIALWLEFIETTYEQEGE